VFELLDKACEERFPLMIHLKVHPCFDDLRSDPRLRDFMRRILLPPQRIAGWKQLTMLYHASKITPVIEFHFKLRSGGREHGPVLG
jgi:hypothetical protein